MSSRSSVRFICTWCEHPSSDLQKVVIEWHTFISEQFTILKFMQMIRLLLLNSPGILCKLLTAYDLQNICQ